MNERKQMNENTDERKKKTAKKRMNETKQADERKKNI